MKHRTISLFVTTVILLLGFSTKALATDYYFYVQFADKNETPYSLSNPSEYLSERAIERRQYFRLSCDSTDLPVNPNYLQTIKTNGFRIHNKTKWLNGATVITSDSASVALLKTFPFVKQIEYTGKLNDGTKKKPTQRKSVEQTDDSGNYGYADAQIAQINGKYLHNKTYRGEDIHIGVLDAGFYDVDKMSAFSNLRIENRLLGTKDFINPESNIFQENSHGASVLSTMASKIDGQYIGTAPDASYWLVRTENSGPEYSMEMDFWVSGIEFLDSVGIDVVNSSLGYTVFDDPNMNFTYSDMNGETARISRAATMAADKGIIVVNSAGNEGGSGWKYIGAPADAKNIITVGAVMSDGTASSFSSFGPTFDGRVKPEIAAWGTQTALMNINGNFNGNGTSFSAPIIAGMMACFLQLAKDQYSFISLDDLFQYVFRSGNTYNSPNERLGYGIPDFEKAADLLLANNTFTNTVSDREILIFMDIASKTLRIDLNGRNFRNAYIQILDINGKLLLNQIVSSERTIIETNGFNQGFYAVHIIFSNGETNTQKIIIK